MTSEEVQNDMVKKGKELGDDERARGIVGDENEEWKVRLFLLLSPPSIFLSLAPPREGSLRHPS